MTRFWRTMAPTGGAILLAAAMQDPAFASDVFKGSRPRVESVALTGPLKDALRSYLGPVQRDTRVSIVSADLTVGKPRDILVYFRGPEWCGSGGCTLLVLAPVGETYRVVSRVTVIWPPIRVLASSNHGWRDIGVHVSGGGQRPREARLSFNGRRYPGNPSLAPASSANAPGKLAISDEEEGVLLPP